DRAGNIESPYRVVRLSAITALSAGGNHSLVLLKDGSVWAWGSILSGPPNTKSNVPIPVSSLNNVTAISQGLGFALALKSDGTVWAWGSGSRGDLGNGGTADSATPVQVSGLAGVRAISAGEYDHGLAARTDGTVWAWGD